MSLGVIVIQLRKAHGLQGEPAGIRGIGPRHRCFVRLPRLFWHTGLCRPVQHLAARDETYMNSQNDHFHDH
jgi:hypothetical protein